MRSSWTRLRTLLHRMQALLSGLNPRSHYTCQYCEAGFKGVFSAKKLRRHQSKEHLFEITMEYLNTVVAATALIGAAYWSRREFAQRTGGRA